MGTLTDSHEVNAWFGIASVIPKLEIQTSGGFTYIAFAPPGTTLATALWRVIRVTDATGVIIHADGNLKFDNVATTLSGLTYT